MTNSYISHRFQAGRGIGSFLGGIFRTLKPLFSMGLSAGKKFVTSDFAKKIGSTALDIGKEAAKNVAVDILEGKKLSDSVDKELADAKTKIASKIKGSGTRKKRKSLCTNEIFHTKKKYNLLN